MKILATIVVGFVVIVAALLFLSCAICAFVPGLGASVPMASVVVACLCLAVMIGGVTLIGAMYKPKEPPEAL